MATKNRSVVAWKWDKNQQFIIKGLKELIDMTNIFVIVKVIATSTHMSRKIK